MPNNSTEFIDGHEFHEIITNNSEWIDSKGEIGERAILDGYNLSKLYLSDLSLQGASLDRTVFDGGNCKRTNFRGAKLRNTSFERVNLSCANFYSTKLTGSSFRHSTLSGASLERSKINWVDFHLCVLHKAKLKNSKIRNCDFTRANLVKTDFESSALIGSIFHRANMAFSNLRNVNFSHSNLSEANLSNADITGAILSNVSTVGWDISNIKCEYIYFEENRENRVPLNRNFTENEFEELYSWFPNFVYYFKDKMHALDPYLISTIVNGLNENIQNLHLQIDEIKGKGFTPQVCFSSRGAHDITSVEEVVTSVLDDNLSTIRDLIGNIENSINPSINKIVSNVLKEVAMPKIEFNAPVQNVITDNHGTINIQSISTSDINKLTKEIDKVKTKTSISENIKNETKKELIKLAAGEIKEISKQGIDWLKGNIGELTSSASVVASALIGS